MKKSEIKEVLDKLNTTKAEMDKMWAELYEDNVVIHNLTDHEMSWRDMNSIAAATLPKTHEKTLTLRMPLVEYLKDNSAESINDLFAKDENKIDVDLLDRIPQDTLLKNLKGVIDALPKEEPPSRYEVATRKLLGGERLNENEISELLWEGCVVYQEEGENRRWTRGVTSVIELNARFFCINWEEGLTEYQENSYYDQPYEVRKVTETKTITVDRWIPVSKEGNDV
jgi:hypothetical protein